MQRAVGIVGIGQTGFSRASGRSEWQLALEAIQNAAADAGIDCGQIDGVVRYTLDNVNEFMVASALGLELRYHSQVGFGGHSGAATIGHAVAAIEAGQASVVCCYRSLNGRSGERYGRGERLLRPNGDRFEASGLRVPGGALSAPYGVLAPGHVMAMWAHRYAHDCAISVDVLSSVLGQIAVDQRAYAVRNPAAVFYEQPLDLETHNQSRIIATPLRLYDFCLETDGAAAVIVAADDVLRGSSLAPVRVLASNQALHSEAIDTYGELMNGPRHRAEAAALFESAGITADDIDVAQVYDATTIEVLLQLEGYGLAKPNQGWSSVRAEGIGPQSGLPVNTSGGHLSEAYLHGMNHVLEAVRQLRGAAVNQVPDAEIALVTSAGGSALVLGR